MPKIPFYDPTQSYEQNYDQGPFGAFADPASWQPTRKPAYEFMGFPLDIPFGIPAGPLLNSKFVIGALHHGFSVCVYKTTRSATHPCHPFPNVLAVKVKGNLSVKKPVPLVANRDYKMPLSITNSFGVPSKDPSIWQPDVTKAVKAAGSGQLVIGSFQGTSHNGNFKDFLADCLNTAQLMSDTGVKVLEINLSCPNEGKANLLCFDVERVAEITRAIKAKIKKPLIIKIAYFVDETQLRNLVTKVGKIVDGIATINTMPSTIVDKNGKQALPGAGRLISGVCGHAVKWAGLEMVERLVNLRKELKLSFVIIGVGGVMKVADFKDYRKAGADLVMSATGAMWNPNLAQEIYDQKGKL